MILMNDDNDYDGGDRYDYDNDNILPLLNRKGVLHFNFKIAWKIGNSFSILKVRARKSTFIMPKQCFQFLGEI